MYRRRRLLIALTPLVMVGGVASYAALRLAPRSFETTLAVDRGDRSPVAIGGSFALIDHRGRPVTDETFRGRLMLIYFGYTFCPDICPTSLADLGTALDMLGEQAEQVAFLFITIDPARDTKEQLAGYVPLFHPRLIGLTGSQAQVERAARAFRVYHKMRPGDGPDDYVMDHASFAYLMGKDGRLLSVFAHGTDPERIASTIRRHL